MKLKEFMRLTARCPNDCALWMRSYNREKENAIARYPIYEFGVNACGQLVLDVDYSMTKEPLLLEDLQESYAYLSPELNMFIGTDWQQRCYEKELTEIEPFVGDDEGICLGLLRQEASWEKLCYKRAAAIEKYNL